MHGNRLEALLELAREAGRGIMGIYSGEFEVEEKADLSPITMADRASHEVIIAGLARIFPGFPVISEEGASVPWEVRRGWRRFFLVDPLDGTKEFVKRLGEFTVNIGLVEDGEAVFGIVYQPVTDTIWLGGSAHGSFKQMGSGPMVPIAVRKPPEEGLTVLVSRSHPSEKLDDYLRTLPVRETLPVGSALKFCLVAEGRADLYPRLSPGPWEWDTAAGQALVEGAGGKMTDLEGHPFRYNKEDLRNGPYLVSA